MASTFLYIHPENVFFNRIFYAYLTRSCGGFWTLWRYVALNSFGQHIYIFSVCLYMHLET